MSDKRQLISAEGAQTPLFVGVDLGGTNIKAGVVDDLGRPVSWISVPTKVEKGPEDVTRRMGQAVKSAIAEADRQAGTFTIYVDGKQDAGGPGLGADASLANDADLCVGGTPQGHHLDGAIDFLRIARGTLADSKTTIDELYAWEFDGPFLYDFTGRKRPANGGAAGAIAEGAQ